MTLRLGYSQASHISAALIEEASQGVIVAVQYGPCDINWGRRTSPSAGLNPDITNAVNKRRMRELFEDHGVVSPTLYDPQAAVAALGEGEVEGGVLIGRPDFHTRGRGFWRCESVAQIDRALRGTRRKAAATHFLRFIPPDEAPNEFRVHILNGRSLRISMKEFNEDRSDYRTVRPPEGKPKKYIRKAAKEAVAATGLNFGAVDMLVSPDQTRCYVLEVNAAPGLGGSMPRVWARAFTEWGESR